jgi:hypothetical protein
MKESIAMIKILVPKYIGTPEQNSPRHITKISWEKIGDVLESYIW